MAEEGKLLDELKVNDLKAELEKRNLDKHGIKLILADRLEKALKAEGHDPATYRFNLNEQAHEAVIKSSTEVSETKPTENLLTEGISQETKKVDEENNQHTESIVALTGDPSNETENGEDEKMGASANTELPVVAKIATTQPMTDSISIEVEGVEDMEHDPIDPEVDGKVEDEPISEESVHREVTVKMKPIPITMDGVKKDEDVSQKSVWVRGLAGSTKAADLKSLFSAHGRVLRAKIYTSKKTAPTAVVFGYVTMAEKADLDVAIDKLNKTQYKGKTITVEKALNSRLPTVKANVPAPLASEKNEKNEGEKKEESSKSSSRRENNRRKMDEKKNIRDRVTTGRPRETRPRGQKREIVMKSRRIDDNKNKSNTSRHDHSTIRRANDRRPAPPTSRHRDLTSGRVPITSRTVGSGRRGNLSGRISYGGGGIHTRVSRPLPRRDEVLDRREMMDLLRRKEEEHRKRENELRMEKEKERIRFEKEQLERQRLELQMAALQQFAVPVAPLDVRSRDYSRGSRDVRRDTHRDNGRDRDSKHVRSDDRRERVERRDASRSSATSRSVTRDHSRSSAAHHDRHHSSTHSHSSHTSQATRDRDAREARSGRDSHRISTRDGRDRARNDYSSSNSHSYSSGGARVYSTESGRAAAYTRDREPAYSSTSSYSTGRGDYGTSSSHYGSTSSGGSVHFNKEFASRSIPLSTSAWNGVAGFGGTTASGTRYEWPNTSNVSASLGSSTYSTGRTGGAAGDWSVTSDLSRTYDAPRRY